MLQRPKTSSGNPFGPIQPLSRAYRENTFPGLNREPLSLGETFEKAEEQESELDAHPPATPPVIQGSPHGDETLFFSEIFECRDTGRSPKRLDKSKSSRR